MPQLEFHRGESVLLPAPLVAACFFLSAKAGGRSICNVL